MTITFGEQLGILLKRSGLTKGEFAETIHVAQNRLGEYISGKRKPSISTLAKLADGLGVTMDFLSGGKMTITFGERLGILIKRSGLKQKEFAETIHVEPIIISQYISGKSEPSFSTLTKLADALGVTMDYLYRGKE